MDQCLFSQSDEIAFYECSWKLFSKHFPGFFRGESLNSNSNFEALNFSFSRNFEDALCLNVKVFDHAYLRIGMTSGFFSFLDEPRRLLVRAHLYVVMHFCMTALFSLLVHLLLTVVLDMAFLPYARRVCFQNTEWLSERSTFVVGLKCFLQAQDSEGLLFGSFRALSCRVFERSLCFQSVTPSRLVVLVGFPVHCAFSEFHGAFDILLRWGCPCTPQVCLCAFLPFSSFYAVQPDGPSVGLAVSFYTPPYNYS